MRRTPGSAEPRCKAPENVPKCARRPPGGRSAGQSPDDSQHDRLRGGRRRAARASTLAVELRSVNHRYLDLTLKLPDELRATRVRAARAHRRGAQARQGRVPRRAQPDASRAPRRSPSIPAASASSPTAAADVRAPVPGATPLSVDEILRWPGVLAEPAVPADELARARSTLVDQALARARRGARPRRRQARRACSRPAAPKSRRRSARVAPRIPAIHAAYVEKLGARLREAGLDPNEDRLKQELALFATKVDVAEELARLTTHVAEVRRVLARRRQRGQASRLPRAGAASRGEHAGLEVGRRRAVAGGARAQGADRADARAGAEHRVEIEVRGKARAVRVF